MAVAGALVVPIKELLWAAAAAASVGAVRDRGASLRGCFRETGRRFRGGLRGPRRRGGEHHRGIDLGVFPAAAEDGAQKLLSEYGVSLVYATLGPKGCHAATASHHITLQSPSGIQVIDTTGAGDIFGGSAMSRLLQYKKAPADLSAQELTQIVRFACTAASLSTQKHGGITSVPEEAAVMKKIGEAYPD